jgi:Ca2+-binding RTX toxin-like protein
VTLALLLMATCLAGVAYAKIISGTNGDDELKGTAKADQISGYNDADTIWGKAGGDDV